VDRRNNRKQLCVRRIPLFNKDLRWIGGIIGKIGADMTREMGGNEMSVLASWERPSCAQRSCSTGSQGRGTLARSLKPTATTPELGKVSPESRTPMVSAPHAIGCRHHVNGGRHCLRPVFGNGLQTGNLSNRDRPRPSVRCAASGLDFPATPPKRTWPKRTTGLDRHRPHLFRTSHFFTVDLRYSASAFFLSLSSFSRPNRSSISTRMTSL
jgi:hypothetical protein